MKVKNNFFDAKFNFSLHLTIVLGSFESPFHTKHFLTFSKFFSKNTPFCLHLKVKC